MWVWQRMVAGAMLLALGGVACAQSPYHGIYIGAGGGVSKAKDPADCSTAPGTFASSCTIEDKKTGWKVFLGYQVNPYLAFEADYADLGTFRTSVGISTGLGFLATQDVSFHPILYGVDVVGALPIGGGFGLLGRIGYFHWKLDAIGTTSLFSPGITDNFHEMSTGGNVDFGVGAKWDFGQNLGVRVEYTRYPKIGDSETTGKSDVDLLSASLLWRFQ